MEFQKVQLANGEFEKLLCRGVKIQPAFLKMKDVSRIIPFDKIHSV